MGLRFAGHDANGREWRRGLAAHMKTFERLLGYHDSVAEALDRGLPVPAWPFGPAPTTGRVALPAHGRPQPAHPDEAGVPAESGVRGSAVSRAAAAPTGAAYLPRRVRVVRSPAATRSMTAAAADGGARGRSRSGGRPGAAEPLPAGEDARVGASVRDAPGWHVHIVLAMCIAAGRFAGELA